MAISKKIGVIRRGPNIILDGLMLRLDATNTNSYPGSGASWIDLSPNAYTGTLINSPTFTPGNGGYFTFDGTNEQVSLGNHANLAPGTGDFTVSFWINPADWSGYWCPLFVTTVGGGLWIGKHDSNFVLRTYGVDDDLQNPVYPTLNQWTMITISRISNTVSMYYNTTVVASGIVTRNYVADNTYLVTDGGFNFYNGKLSIAMYYNKGLTSQEVTQNYDATKGKFGL